MYDFHKDKQRYFTMQYYASRDSIVPFVEKYKKLGEHIRVMEIGCAEGGVLKAFLEKSSYCLGVELMEGRLLKAKEFLHDYVQKKQIDFVAENIYNFSPEQKEGFDIIILKDVIEHIPNQEKLLTRLKVFLKKDGLIFIGFPSWYMPFGGHQQMCKNKFLSKTPYLHLFPRFLYKAILKAFNDKKQLQNLLDIYDTGISTKRFERILKRTNYTYLEKTSYFIPPIYYYKFKKKQRVLHPIVRSIPLFREFFTMSAYYIVSRNENLKQLSDEK
jgi:2-polyprenyl-3-methyl-5-hydroxy-6-metoxy-1,4-benzoquinol methylase